MMKKLKLNKHIEYIMKYEKIYIAEDDTQLGRDFMDFLKAKHFECKLFTNGYEFLNASSDDFDAAIIDVNLKRVGGFSLLKEIRNQKPNTLIIVVSGNNIDHDRMEALELGADYFLPKPVSLDVLSGILVERESINHV